MADAATELWIWRHFAFELPSDWEMLQFSRDPRRGRCAFADREGYRFELDWRGVPGPPDFERMLADYRGRLADGGLTHLRRVELGPWRGWAGRTENGPSLRVGRHFAAERCLVETVFPDLDENDPRPRAVVESLRELPPGAAGFRRWRALGLDVEVPGGFALTDCRAEPGHARLAFGRRPEQVERLFERRGFVGEWLKVPVPEWLRGWAGPHLQHGAAAAARVEAGHEVHALDGASARRAWRAARRAARAEAWLCPRDGRLYARLSLGAGPPGAPPSRLACGCGGRPDAGGAPNGLAGGGRV
jgi:hypothetical protein